MKRLIELAGGVYKGVQKDVNGNRYALIHDQMTGSTLMLPEHGITAKKVRAKLAFSRERFVANG